MVAYATFWKLAMESTRVDATPVDRLMTLVTRVSRHPNVLAYLLTSSGVGFSAVQFLAWIKGVELADHLAYSAERRVASHTVELEETLEMSHDIIRDGVCNMAWWSNLVMTLVMARLVFWVTFGRDFSLSDLFGSKFWRMLCGFIKEANAINSNTTIKLLTYLLFS